MTRQEAADLIRGSNGKIISLEFVKRTTGELRQMVCRTGVTNYVSGKGMSYDAASKDLLTVWDMNAPRTEGKGGYRSIPIDGLARVKVDGEWQPVEDAVISVPQ